MLSATKNMFKSFQKNRGLIWQMSKREVMGRYKGSFFGLAWSLFNPLMMLVVYTFVFSVVFKTRWGSDPNAGKTDFAIVLFIGLIIFNLFSECIGRAPSLITSNVNYVKKVVFPLEVLAFINFFAAMFHALVSFFVLLLAILVFKQHIHLTLLLLPIIVLPLMLAILGLSWILSALGVFVRDIAQTIGIIISVLMFMSPVFYPISALPVTFQKVIMLNPLAFMIEEARKVVFWGVSPDWLMLVINLVIGGLICVVGYSFFQKVRKGFADVL
ncbi:MULTISPECIES: ABC transporter permease [unclassified Pantoea]|uniref:ABC transporter permease n=1 Tax=unclassified Pantoea TaxID=2630326 RepID=UPI0001E0C275|nr:MULTISPECIES: ABC transporter permease [unclassified Pantoea]EFM19406.1 ABC-2 type transporter [Pantoea sp. aB]QNQ59988.1 ABC transporter permease [Pantoea sp. MT58]